MDWSGERYVGLTLNWDYAARTCDISMPGYIEHAPKCFQHHPPPLLPEDVPHPHTPPTYGAKIQYPPEPDTSILLLDAADTKHLQAVLGTFSTMPVQLTSP